MYIIRLVRNCWKRFFQRVQSLAVIIVLLGTAPLLPGQGFIIFTNGGAGVAAPVYHYDQMTLLEGERYQAQLCYRQAGTTGPLVPHEETEGFQTGDSAGFFFGTERELPRAGEFEIQVRVWNTLSGDSWEQASLRWQSNIIFVHAGSATTPWSTPVGLDFTWMKTERPKSGGVRISWRKATLNNLELEAAPSLEGPWSPFDGEIVQVDPGPFSFDSGLYEVVLEAPLPAMQFFRLRATEPDPEMLLNTLDFFASLGIDPATGAPVK